MLEHRPQAGEIDRFDAIDEERRMRISDICAGRLRERAQRQIGAVGIHRPGKRDLAPPRPRRPHIDGDMPVRQDFGFEQPGRGLDPNPWVTRLAVQQFGDTAGGIAAGLGLAAVRIADPHQELSRGMTRRLEQDQLIATDTGAPIGKRGYGLGTHRDRGTTKIEHDKIIAEPVHFQERDFAHGAAYMAARPAVSNAEAPSADWAPAPPSQAWGVKLREAASCRASPPDG